LRISGPPTRPMSRAINASSRFSVIRSGELRKRASAFLQSPDPPDSARIARELVGPPHHPEGAENFRKAEPADELEERVVRRRAAEGDLGNARRQDDGVEKVSSDRLPPGRHDPRADLTCLAARVSDDDALDRAAPFGDQKGRRHLVHETIEQGATIRSEIRL